MKDKRGGLTAEILFLGAIIAAFAIILTPSYARTLTKELGVLAECGGTKICGYYYQCGNNTDSVCPEDYGAECGNYYPCCDEDCAGAGSCINLVDEEDKKFGPLQNSVIVPTFGTKADTDAFYILGRPLYPEQGYNPLYYTLQNQYYTNNTNITPSNCLGMLHNMQTCNQTWRLNATGANAIYSEFFIDFNSTYHSNTTARFKIAIIP